jgi:hypothetical protein
MFDRIASINNPVLKPIVGIVNETAGGTPALSKVLQNLITLAISAGGLWLLIQLILGGYFFITAGGDKEGVQKGVSKIKNALTGMVILLSIFVIMWIVEALFGIPLLTFNIPILY